MDTTRAKETLARARTSRFAQDVVGPKVTKPLGAWLQTALDPEDTEDGSEGSVASEGSDLSVVAESLSSYTADASNAGETPNTTPADEDIAIFSETLAKPGAKEIALAVKDRIKEHNLVVVAGGIAFWGLLAIPAVLFSLVSIGGLVFDADTIKEQVQDQMDGAPEEVTNIIAEQFESVASSPKGGLITGLILGIVLALWTASGAMAKLMGTLNTIYGVSENRKFVKLRGTALAMTLGGVVFMVATMFFLTAFPAILKRVDGIGDGAAWLFSLATYPLLGLVMILGLGVLYRFGPARTDRYKVITAGAVVATGLWVLAVIGFSVYTTTAATYNETYGSLGGMVMLLLFLLITALMVLIGAEVHAVMSNRGSVASPDDHEAP